MTRIFYFFILTSDILILISGLLLLRRRGWRGGLCSLIRSTETGVVVASEAGIIGPAKAGTASHSRRRAERTVISRLSGLSRLPGLQGVLGKHRQGLVGPFDQAAAVECRIVDKLPLVVFFLVVIFADRVFLAEAHHAHDGSAAEDRRRKLIAGSGESVRVLVGDALPRRGRIGRIRSCALIARALVR